MASSVDMSLDDIIKSRRNSDRTRGRGRARRGRGAGPAGRSFIGGRMIAAGQRGPLGINARPSSFTIAKASSDLWMFN